jgi:hypothetical protein
MRHKERVLTEGNHWFIGIFKYFVFWDKSNLLAAERAMYTTITKAVKFDTLNRGHGHASLNVLLQSTVTIFTDTTLSY